ncbi:peptidoglycan-binding protein [Kitasatospora sp. NPDC090091]|uniref:peptidoglycan-binding protein n=1 Tax=Kitasatospora sp. NPDC090091 TaxID=3364081 RepID=UPI003825F853
MDELATTQGPQAETGPDAASHRRPYRALVAVTAAAVLAIGGGVVAAGFIKSPGERAAEAAAPAPSVITATVESRRLTDTVVVRGQVTAAQTVDVAPQGGGKDGGGRMVVTAVRVRAGDTLTAGQVLLEVAGRPVFVLDGEIPVFRDLKPGSEGKDVAQMQTALSGMGFSCGGDKSGSFGPGTRTAVEALYRKLGYEAPKSPDANEDQLRAARDRVTAAERAAKAAAETRDAARTAHTGAGTPVGPPSAAPADDKGAGAAGNGPDPVKAAEQQLVYAKEDLARARTDLTGLEAKAGAMLPASEVVFLGGFPARVDAVGAQVGAEVREKAVTVSAGALLAKGALAPHEKGLVRPGMRVRLLSETTGIAADATVTTVADTPTDPMRSSQNGQGGQGTSGTAGRSFEMIVTPSTTLDPRLAGQDVRLTVEAAASDGDVLVVPLSAVSAGADGRTVVTVREPNGGQHGVEVRPGTTGSGYVQVTPLAAGQLAPGDKVVVGVSRTATGQQRAGGTR